MAYKRQVIIMEYERGWGSRIDDIELYADDIAAKKRVEEFNSYNTAKTAPDWYMIAELGNIVDVPD